MTNYIAISIGIIFICFGFYKGLIKKEHTFLKYSITPREKDFYKKPPSKKTAIVEGVIEIFFGLLLISIGLY